MAWVGHGEDGDSFRKGRRFNLPGLQWTFDGITSLSYIPPLPHPTASRVALTCRFLAASYHISQSLGHQKGACRLLDPVAALLRAQQPPSCQATLGYHQPILPSPLDPVPCNLTASLPQSSPIHL